MTTAQKVGTFRVHKIYNRHVMVENRYTAHKTWSITHVKEGRLPLLVVDCTPGLTIVDESGQMLTSWHAGISAGNLARRYTADAMLRLTHLEGGL